MRSQLAAEIKMADVKKTVDTLRQLKFADLDDEWVREIWDHDFTEVDALPIHLDEALQSESWHHKTLKNSLQVLKPWAQGQQGSLDEGFWTVLVENSLPHQKLLALLFVILDSGSKRTASTVQKEASISAANFYFHMLMVPGSGAFKIFHPMLYQKCVDILKLWTTPHAASEGSSSGRSKGRGRGKKRVRDWNSDEDSGESGDEDDSMRSSDNSHLHKSLLVLLQDTVGMLKNTSLSVSPDSAVHTIQVLVELARCHANSQLPKLAGSDFHRVQNPQELVYLGLKVLCTPAHGDVTSNLRTVYKNLLPSLLMLIGGKGVAAQTIPHETVVIKDAAVRFICHMLESGGTDVLNVARILLQHMCTKVPDKAEYRTKVGQTVQTILKALPVADYARMIEWLIRYGKNVKAGYRVFAVELFCLLLNDKERQPDDSLSKEYCVYLSHKALILALLARCSDVSPTVQARAIAGFSQCVTSSQPVIANTIKDMMTPRVAGRPPMTRLVPTPEAQRVQTMSAAGQSSTTEVSSLKNMDTLEQSSAAKSIATEGNAPAVDEQTSRVSVDVAEGQTPLAGGQKSLVLGNTPLMSIQITPGADVTLPDAAGVLSMLKRRARDDKVFVRKAALQALEQLIKLSGVDFVKEDLDVIHERCCDVTPTVRKQAIISLTELLSHLPADKEIQWAWLDGVLPLVVDRETSVQEKCIGLLEEVILNHIVPYNKSTGESHGLVWSLLSILASNEGVELKRFLQKVCRHWSGGGKLRPNLISALQTHINTPNNNAAWLMLAEIAPFTQKLQADFILDYWNDHARWAPESENITVQQVLQVLGWLSKKLSAAQAQPLIDDLKARLLLFNSPPDVISAAIHTLSKLCKTTSSDEALVKKVTSEWCRELLTASDQYLSAIILNQNSDSQLNEEEITCHLFTLGEVAQLCPHLTPKRIFMLVQSLIATPCITSLDGSSQSNQNQSAHSSMSSQSSQPTSQGTASSQGFTVLSQFSGSNMSSKIRAHAFLTLGKLCLQNMDLAKKCIAAMARELETSNDFSVRNNVVVIMCDLCIRYTTLVDRYIPNIAVCVKDPAPLIRKQTLTMLTHLLQEDFIKWKGSLFYRVITSVIDELEEIRRFAEFCLVHVLMQRHTTMFFHHFIECVFHFNNYTEHNVYNKFTQSEREQTMFSLKGQENQEKRQQIYRFMLEHMTDEQRFQLTAKLTQEVLAGVVDGVIKLDADSAPVLQDAIHILTCQEIKLSTLQSKPQDEDVVDQVDMAAVVMATAKKTLISQVVKKNVIENIVPIITSLKHILEKHRSPLLSDLMLYLRELMKDYKNEVKDILSADKQLANEIEFDLRRFEEQQAEAEATPPPAVPTNGSTPVKDKQGESEHPSTPGRVNSPHRNAAVNGGSPVPRNSPQRTETGPASPGSKSPVPGTPKNRQSISMVTQAVLNSIKSRSASKKTGVRFIEGTPQTKEASQQFKTPASKAKKKVSSRAISTPTGNVGEITFSAVDSNLSAITCSPIPTNMPLRIYSQGSQTPTRATDAAGKENLVCMLSPDQPLPKLRQWKVKTKEPVPDPASVPADVLEGLSAGQPLSSAENVDATSSSNRPRRKSRNRSQRS